MAKEYFLVSFWGQKAYFQDQKLLLASGRVTPVAPRKVEIQLPKAQDQPEVLRRQGAPYDPQPHRNDKKTTKEFVSMCIASFTIPWLSSKFTGVMKNFQPELHALL